MKNKNREEEKKEPKCKKTVSGRHLFMPMSYFSMSESKIWVAHGVSPFKCVACGLVDDEVKRIAK